MASLVEGTFDSSSASSLDTSLATLNNHCANGVYPVASIVKFLMARKPGTFELVMCSAGTGFDVLRQRILSDMAGASSPRNILHSDAIQRLCVFATSLPPTVPLDRMALSRCQVIGSAFRVLEHLSRWDLHNAMATVNNSRLKNDIGFQHAYAKPKDLSYSLKGHVVYARGNIDKMSQDHDFNRLFVDVVKSLIEHSQALFDSLLVPGVAEYARNRLLEGCPAQTLKDPSPLHPRIDRDHSSDLRDDPQPAQTPLREESSRTSHEQILLYLDTSSAGYGKWPVFVAERAMSDLKDLSHNSPEIFEFIQPKIKELSLGHFSPANQVELLTNDYEIPLYKAALSAEIHIIYQIDCGAPVVDRVGRKQESQCIRVFGIYRDQDIDVKFWTSVAIVFEPRTRGSQRILVTPPLIFSRRDAGLKFEQDGPEAENVLNDSHLLDLHRTLSLQKFVSYSHNFLDAIMSRDASSFVFSMSTREDDIVRHKSSCLVLGRSGTGKTTTMLFRMKAMDIGAEKSGHKIRQVFVTQSRTLAQKVKQYYSQLSKTSASTESSLGHNGSTMEGWGFSLQDISDDLLDEPIMDTRLPIRFSELTDDHFPLFLSFDQLCNMLEADLGLLFQPRPQYQASGRRRGSQKTLRGVRHPLVTYDYFLSEIFPSFGDKVRRIFDPSLLYSEFVGVIKGSEPTLAVPTQVLDQTFYENGIGKGCQAIFDKNYVYSLFMLYQKRRPPQSYDDADRTHALVHALKDGIPAGGKTFDFLYVDEIQDNLIIDFALLRKLCPNPHGIFFAGDTAQTISVGSAFRFNDLKAALYRMEMADPLVKAGIRAPVKPQFFELSTNYRSHAIIVRNEDGKQRLKDKIGESAIILTVYESKGMEFNDVLLYNFFYDSPCDTKDWEAVARALSDPSTSGTYYRLFDRYRYAILQSELKTLYVGLTRARERVWFWDISDKGTLLKRLYEQAAYCFLKAGMPWWRNVAIAYGLRQAAQRISANDPRRRETIRKAARQFRAHAPEAPRMPDQLTLYTNAARCFVEAQEHHQAAECFALGQKYNDALWHCKVAKSFDEGLELISQYPSEVDPELVESFKYMAKIAFTTKQRVDSPENVVYLQKAARICDSSEEYITFLDDHGFTRQLAVYLDRILGRHEDAAKVYEQVSAHAEAVAQWIKVGNNTARERAASCLLGGLRHEVPYGSDYQKPTQQVEALLELASTVQTGNAGIARE
ncbi:hypothetical protein FRB99_008794, partial [Tulasnella sp. 403]